MRGYSTPSAIADFLSHPPIATGLLFSYAAGFITLFCLAEPSRFAVVSFKPGWSLYTILEITYYRWATV